MATQTPDIEIVYLDPLSETEVQDFEEELARLLVDAWFNNGEKPVAENNSQLCCGTSQRPLSCAEGGVR